MKMSDVRVGMRLRSTTHTVVGLMEVTVTEITERGFKYKLDRDVCVHPRLGITFAADGGEHFGHDGEAYYEPAEHLSSAPERAPTQSPTPTNPVSALTEDI